MRVFWDTPLLAYHLDRQSPFHDQVTALRVVIRRGNHEVVTSRLAIAEALVPTGWQQPPGQFEDWLAQLEGLATIVDFTREELRSFVTVRAQRAAVRTPDAVHVSCAVASGCDVFISGDQRLLTTRVVGLELLDVGAAIARLR